MNDFFYHLINKLNQNKIKMTVYSGINEQTTMQHLILKKLKVPEYKKN